MPVISESKDYVVFVGGLGLKSGCSDPTGCTKEFWGSLQHPDKDLPDVMDGNGGNLSVAAAGIPGFCTVTNNGSGKLRITYSAGFEDCVPGLLAYCNFTATYTTGLYEILDYDSSSYNWIDIDETHASDTTCACTVGGAHASLQTAVDETDANGTSPHTVYILDDLPETFTSPTQEIDLDSGGDLSGCTKKRIIATTDHGVPLSDGSFITIDANSQSGASCFNFGTADNITLEHFRCIGSPVAQIKFTASSPCYNFHLIGCKTEGTVYGIQCTTGNNKNIYIEDGAYTSSGSYPIYVESNDLLMHGVYILAGHASYPGLRVNDAAKVVVTGCVLRGNNNTGIQMVGACNVFVEDSTFYLFTSCIAMSNTGCALSEYGNIFYVSVAATSKAISRTNGTILASNYSCMWAYDGAPSSTTRWGVSGSYVPYNAIEEDPLFVSGGSGDFRLSGPSPAIRASKPTLGLVSY